MTSTENRKPAKRISMGLYTREVENIACIREVTGIHEETTIIRTALQYYARRLRLASQITE
jgi:hypothetical protein